MQITMIVRLKERVKVGVTVLLCIGKSDLHTQEKCMWLLCLVASRFMGHFSVFPTFKEKRALEPQNDS